MYSLGKIVYYRMLYSVGSDSCLSLGHRAGANGDTVIQCSRGEGGGGMEGEVCWG